MTLKAAGPGTAPREIDRWDGGVGWLAHPEETMERASHAIVVDGECWLVDPVDTTELDDLLADLGPVAGVVVLFDRHARDAAAIAARHGVPIYVPDWIDGMGGKLEGEVKRLGDTLTGDRYRVLRVADSPVWQEAALYDDATGTLVVGESLGNAAYFRAGSERLGVHPGRRFLPPRRAFGRLEPDRILVGHGPGVMQDAAPALEDALANARRRIPTAYLGIAQQFVSG